MLKNVLSVGCVAFIGFDNVLGPVLSHQYPLGTMQPEEFSRISPILAPKPELTGRALSFSEWKREDPRDAGRRRIYLYCAEELRADHYARRRLRFTLCFVLLADVTAPQEQVQQEVARYTAPLLITVEGLRNVELQRGYLVSAQSDTSNNASPLPVSTMSSSMSIASLDVGSLSETLRRSTTHGTEYEFTDRSVTAMDLLSATHAWRGAHSLNAFLDLYTAEEECKPLCAVVEQIYQCLVDPNCDEVAISKTDTFHLKPAAKTVALPSVAMHQIPVVVRSLPLDACVLADMTLVDTYDCVTGDYTITEIAKKSGIPAVLAKQAIRELAAAGYVVLVDPFDFEAVFRITDVFIDVLRHPELPQRKELAEYVLQATLQPFAECTPLRQHDSSDPGVHDNSVGVFAYDKAGHSTSFTTANLNPPPPDQINPATITQDATGALMSALSRFHCTSVSDVQQAMLDSPWGALFSRWSVAALRAMIRFACVYGWLEPLNLMCEVDAAWLSEHDGSIRESPASSTPPRETNSPTHATCRPHISLGLNSPNEDIRSESGDSAEDGRVVVPAAELAARMKLASLREVRRTLEQDGKGTLLHLFAKQVK